MNTMLLPVQLQWHAAAEAQDVVQVAGSFNNWAAPVETQVQDGMHTATVGLFALGKSSHDLTYSTAHHIPPFLQARSSTTSLSSMECGAPTAAAPQRLTHRQVQ